MGRKRPAQTVADVGAQGGKARAEALSPDERTDIARHAAESRWRRNGGPGIPIATHSGDIRIGNVVLPCAVLEDGTRVLTQKGVFQAIGRTGQSSGFRETREGFSLPVFL